MSKSVHSVKLQPYASSDLNRLAYSAGDVVYDQTNGTLRVMDGENAGGTQILRSDLANVKSTALNKSINFGTGVVTATRFIGAVTGAILGDTPPVPPTAQIGTLWFNTTSGKLYIYYNDGDSTQWIQPMTPSYSSGGGGSGTVNSGTAGQLTYYANTGSVVAGLSNVTWANNTLSITGAISSNAQKNYMRFHWDTLTDLNNEAPPGTWHGMVAHVHATGRLYVAHSANWLPLALLSDVAVTGIQAGTNVTVSSVGGVYTINAASGGGGGGITTEDAQDATASLFSNGTQTGITFTYNDAGNALSATVSAVILGTGTSGNYVASVQTSSGITGGSAGSAGAALSLAIDTTVVSTLIGVQTLTNKTISGASNTITNIANSSLTNSSITINGSSVSLGGTVSISTASTTESLTNKTISGASNTITNIANSSLTNSSITINGSSVSLGGTVTISTASTLESLTNVTITSATTGQVLKYNGTRWINDVDATSGGAGVGTVTSVSVTSANGFAGTVATSSSTPAITITTSISGVLKGNSTAISAATSGTDYAPGTSGLATGIVKSTNITGALTIAVAGTDYQAPVSATGILKSSGVSGNVSAATAGTDYQAPVSATGILKSSGVSGNVSAATAGTDYQAPITLTTTGSSGMATFSGNTLNIPQYSSGGATTFNALTDSSSAGLTVDKIYLPAITRLDVTANGSSSYSFDQYATTNPTAYAISGTTIAFNLNVSGHPFLIQTSGGTNYSVGLVHVSTTGVVSTGSSAQGQVTGTLYWKIPFATTGNYRYICSIHGGMVGVITIKDFAIL